MSIKLKVFASILAAIVITIVCLGVVFALPSADFVIDGSISYEVPKPYTKEGDYYYITMGSIDAEGTQPIKWKLVGYDEGPSKSLEERYIKYNKDDDINGIMSGKKGVFVQDTCVTAEKKSFLSMNNCSGLPPLCFHKGSQIYANDYATSDIRKYLIGQPSDASTTTIFDDYHINKSSDPVYTQITQTSQRTLSDLYATAAVSADDGGPDPNGVEYPTEDSAIPDKSTLDSLWLLSVNEVRYLLSANYENYSEDSGMAWDVEYWLRSPCPSLHYSLYVGYVSTSGAFNSYVAAYSTYAVRAAFYMDL